MNIKEAIEGEFPKPEGEFFDSGRRLSSEEVLRARALIVEMFGLKEGDQRRILFQDGYSATVFLKGGVMEIVDWDGERDNGYYKQRVHHRLKIRHSGEAEYMEETGDFDFWRPASPWMTNNLLYNTLYARA